MKTFSQLGLMLVLIIIMACGQVSKKSSFDVESEHRHPSQRGGFLESNSPYF